MSEPSEKLESIGIDDLRWLLRHEETKEIYKDVIPHFKITQEIDAMRDRMGLGLKPWEYRLKYKTPEERRMDFALKSVQENTRARLKTSLYYMTMVLIGLAII